MALTTSRAFWIRRRTERIRRPRTTRLLRWNSHSLSPGYREDPLLHFRTCQASVGASSPFLPAHWLAHSDPASEPQDWPPDSQGYEWSLLTSGLWHPRSTDRGHCRKPKEDPAARTQGSNWFSRESPPCWELAHTVSPNALAQRRIDSLTHNNGTPTFEPHPTVRSGAGARALQFDVGCLKGAWRACRQCCE